MLLVEVFDKPVNWEAEVDTQYEFQARFEINDTEYTFHAYAEEGANGKDIWEIEFKIDHVDYVPMKDKYKISGTGNATTVFATVLSIMKSIIEEKNIEVFRFSAKEPSRIKLYDAMAKRLTPMGWIVRNYMETGDKVYEFTRG